MTWTSTPRISNQTAAGNLGQLPAVLFSGMGSGMLLALCLHFGNEASGYTHAQSSWLLTTFFVAMCLGLLGADRWIKAGRIHRWGMVGWTGLITGILSWLQPVLAGGLSKFWDSSASTSFGSLFAIAITALSVGALPGLFAGLTCGAACQAAGQTAHPHASGSSQASRFGWIIVTGSLGFLVANLFFHPFFGLEFSAPMTALVWLLMGAGGLVVKAGSVAADLTDQEPDLQDGTPAALGATNRMWLHMGILAASSLAVWLRLSDWVWGGMHFWHVSWSCLAFGAVGLGLLLPFDNKTLRTNSTIWGLGVFGCITFALLFFYHDLPFWLVALKQKLTDSTEGFTLHALLYVCLFGGFLFVPMYGIGCLSHTLCPPKKALPFLLRTLMSGSLVWIIMHHLFIPTIGLSRIAIFPSATALALTLFFLLQQRPKWAGMSRLASGVLFVLLVSYAGSKFEKNWRLVFSQADDLSTGYFKSRDHSLQWAYRSDQILYREAPQGTVAIHSYDYPGDTQLELRINGEVIERGYVHQIKPVLNTMIPYVLQGNPERVAIFGLRAGLAAGIFASMPAVQHLDGIEPRKSLREVIAKFAASNGNLLERPNFQYHQLSPSLFLRSNARTYDVIINQHARPWRTGDASTFTLDFYQSCRGHLSENGLMVQNLHLAHLDTPTIETILATFGSVFPQTSVWNIGHGEYLLIGTTAPRSWPMETLQQRIDLPEVQAVLQTQGLETWPVILSTQVVSFENGFHLVPDESIMHSTQFPSLRVTATRSHPAPAESTFFENANEQFQTHPPLLLTEFTHRTSWTIDQMRSLSLLQIDHQFFEPGIFRSIVRRWLELSPDETALHLLSASTSNAESHWAYEAARLGAYIRSFSAEDQPPLDLIKQTTYQVLMAYREQRSIFHQPNTELLQSMLQHLIKADPDNQRVYRMNLVELAWDRQDDASFQQYSIEAFDPDESEFGPADFSADPLAPHRTLAWMAEYWWRQGQLDKARDVCIQALQAGYIGPEAAFHHPALERVVRKVLFAMDLNAESKNENANQLELESILPSEGN